MNKDTLLELAKKYLDGTATEEEKQALHNWYDTADDGEIETVFSNRPEAAENVEDRIFSRIQRQMHPESEEYNDPEISGIPVIKRRRPAAWLAAAAMAGIIACGAVFFLNRSNNDKTIAGKEKPVSPAKKEDVLPGSDKAKLVLGDGTVVILEDEKDGAIQQTAGITIKKHNGQLLYDASAPSAKTGEVTFNTISTPRGGQYHVILPDGSKVWLNASSSLHFPTAFTGKERRVELTGEAYFEVAKNKQMPFIAAVNNAEVEVLGTHFNIMGYDDEQMMKTTLLEGSVRVKAGSMKPEVGSQTSDFRPQTSAFLKPGQQASISTKSNQSSPIPVQTIQVQTVDVDEAVAWKNGMFQFNNTDIPTIMRQVSRWYDVEVAYENTMPVRSFSGEIPRNVPLTKMLQLLDLSDVRFRVEGKKIIVLH